MSRLILCFLYLFSLFSVVDKIEVEQHSWANPLQGRGGRVLESILADFGWKADDTLNWSPVARRTHIEIPGGLRTSQASVPLHHQWEPANYPSKVSLNPAPQKLQHSLALDFCLLPLEQTFVVTRTFSLPSRKRSMMLALCITVNSPLSSATLWPSLVRLAASQDAISRVCTRRNHIKNKLNCFHLPMFTIYSSFYQF